MSRERAREREKDVGTRTRGGRGGAGGGTRGHEGVSAKTGLSPLRSSGDDDRRGVEKRDDESNDDALIGPVESVRGAGADVVRGAGRRVYR
jgi:hypothetical protein